MKLQPAILALLLLGACGSPDIPDRQRLDGVDWKLMEVNGLPWLHDVSLRLDGDRLTGIGPCNAYSGRRAGTAPAFGALELNATDMPCASPIRQRAEAEYLTMLPRATEIRRDHSRMVLRGPGLMMVFDRREARGDEVF
ncbi:META domain-containing protein [Paracoccus aurantiacus]|nr:META domain-containing protein [Paracoccus aurantiacus]